MAKLLKTIDGYEEDVQIKMQIVKNVYAGCTRDLDSSQMMKTFMVPIRKPKERFKTYLCLKKNSFSNMTDLITRNSKRNRIMYKRSKTGKTRVEDENYSLRVDLQNFMKTLMLEQRILPTTKTVLPAFQNLSFVPPSSFRRKIRQQGFTWQKLPNTKYSFIVEKPKHLRERNQFLKKIKQYRAECRYMVYITDQDTTAFSEIEYIIESGTGSKHRSLVMAVSPNDGRKHHIFNSPRERQENIQLWVLHMLLCRLPSNCVLVFEDVVGCAGAPTKENSKTEMVEWMLQKGIPFSPDMHKAELYELIVNFKRTLECTMNAFDTKLESRGFTVLRKPIGLFDVGYYKQFWKDLKKAETYPFLDEHLNYKTAIAKFQEFLEDQDLVYWKHLEAELIEAERKCTEEDALIEDMIEKVMAMVVTDGWSTDEVFEDVLDEDISSDDDESDY